ncbi:MAG: hypothetical protein AAGG48_26695 [Planctomycetota bacterium]
MSATQAAGLLGRGSKQDAEAVLRRIERSRLIEQVGGAIIQKRTEMSPLIQWKAKQSTNQPNFDAIAYELKRRRFQHGRLDSIWKATSRGFRALGFSKMQRPSRRADWDHDVGLTSTWLSLRPEIELENAHWILEDDFRDYGIEMTCKPDALIERANCTPEYIEYGGAYSAETLRNKFESWRHLDWRLY